METQLMSLQNALIQKSEGRFDSLAVILEQLFFLQISQFMLH